MKSASAPPGYSVEFLPLERRLIERRKLRRQQGILHRERRQMQRRQSTDPM